MSVELWRSEAWRADATAWLDTQLGLAGARRTGAVEQAHVNPWATVLTTTTDGGRVWLKAAAPSTAFEIRLYQLLVPTVPRRVLTPVAADPERGWILLPDGGPRLRDLVSGPDLVAPLAAALPHYAELQRSLAPYVPEMLELGLHDMRPAAMPARFAEAMDAASRLSGPEADEPLRRLDSHRGDFARWCEELAGLPGGASVDHNDLHQGNVLMGDLTATEAVRFYDWGDAVVAHPFASMLVPLSWARRAIGDAAVRQLRDAYLEPFSDEASPRELRAALELACHIAKAARALTWVRAVEASAPGDLEEGLARAPLESLLALLDDSYLGGA